MGIFIKKHCDHCNKITKHNKWKQDQYANSGVLRILSNFIDIMLGNKLEFITFYKCRECGWITHTKN